MSVAQLPDGRWYVAGRPGYWPDDPKRTREYFGKGDDAELRARARDNQLGKKKKNSPGSIHFAQIAAEYFEIGKGRMTAATVQSLEYLIFSRLIPAFGQYQAIRIDADAVDQYVGIRRRSVSATTVHSEITYLIAILSWAANPRRRRIPFNPLAGYRKPARDDARIMPPTADELAAIIKHSAEHLQRALIISYFTGIRPGEVELFSLGWSDVDWSREVLYVRGARKGGPEVRIVPLHPFLFDCLSCWLESDMPRPDMIIHYRGRPVSKIKTAFAAAKRKAGITRRIRPYDFRHAAITGMLLRGVDPRTASEIAGHSRPDTTTRIYTYSNLEAAIRAVNGMDNPFDRYDVVPKK